MNKTDTEETGEGSFVNILKGFFETRKINVKQEAKMEANSIEKETKSKETKVLVPESEVVKNDIKCTYISPISFEMYVDYLASKLKEKDLSVLCTVLVCKSAEEGKRYQIELAKHDMKNILLVLDYATMESIMPIWPEGLVQKFAIISQDILPKMHKKNIDLLILNEIPPENFIFQVNSNCEFLCLLTHQAKQQQENQKSMESTSSYQPSVIQSPPTDPEMENLSTSIPQQPEENKECVLKKFLSMGRFYSNIGLIAWSSSPVLSCNSIMGVSGIHSSIKVSMEKMKFPHDRAQNVQRYAWPHAASGQSMIVIGHEKCGKSWSYIPSICERMHKATEGNSNWKGPLCILVTASIDEGQQLQKVLEEIIPPTQKFKLFCTLWEGTFPSEANIEMINSCGILITTVEMMLQLCYFEKKRRIILHPETVRCLVLDNLEKMCRNDALKTPMMLNWLTSKFVFNKHQTQLIITGNRWMEDLMADQLMPVMPDVLLIFEDGLEAAVFGGVKLTVKFVSYNDYEECHSLLEVLSVRDLVKERIVIVFYKEEDCLQVVDKLLVNKVPHCYYETEDREQQEEFKTKKGIIILRDHMITRLKCGPVDLLINYTLTHTWHKFKFRFNLFHANYKTQNLTAAESIIFLSPEETEQCWLFCDFLLKHNMAMPLEWLDYLNNFRIKKERLLPRLNVKLCRQLFIYGNCLRRTCHYRHEIKFDDLKPIENIPLQGKVYFRLLNCLDPTYFWVSLVEYPENGKAFTNPLAVLNVSIQKFYAIKENQINIVNPFVGDICVIAYNKHYERFIVTSIDELPIVEVKQLDWGTEHLKMIIDKLLVCAEPFCHHKFGATNLRLTGIMPYSMDRIWHNNEKRFIRKNFFKKFSAGDRIYNATIDFVFGDTIFVDNVYTENGNELRKLILDNLRVYDDNLVRSRQMDAAKNVIKET